MACPPAVKSVRLSILIVALLFILAHLTFLNLSTSGSSSLRVLRTFSSYHLTHEPLIPRRIWQTWLTRLDVPDGVTSPDAELLGFARTWAGRNPGYEYTSLDDASALAFVRRYYGNSPQIVQVFEEVTEPVIRADLIRYLVLYARGGVYSDYDTEAWRSIDLWTGPDLDNRQIGLILGVEYDQREDENRMPGTGHHVQFCQWTLASRPGHPVMRHVLETVLERVLEAHMAPGGIVIHTPDDVLNMTGPQIFSEAVRKGISDLLGEELSFKDFSMLQGPAVYGDVMILPINAFASGVPHSGAADWGNDQQLVGHHFKGKWKEGLADA